MIASLYPPPALPAERLGQRFLQIFGTYLWESLAAPNTPPTIWRTLQYPIRPRVLWQNWKDPTQLVGVRFGHQTTYGLLDIDAGSPYCNPRALADIGIALETIGITRTLLLRSSLRGGIHLYFPLERPIPTFGLAVVVEACLKVQGFEIAKGILEVFPNVKTYGVHIKVEYNGHRLPLQPYAGSCILDINLNPVGDSLTQFLRDWDNAAAGQDWELLQAAILQARKARKQQHFRRSLSPPVEGWKADLETELAAGWTGSGQTNHLLKTIACYGIVLLGIEDVEPLTDYIVETATQLPGYREYCGHQHEIYRRARAWANSTANIYWPLGTRPKARQPDNKTINQQRAKDAQRRITDAVAHIQQTLSTPLRNLSIRDLAQRITQIAHCSLATLYKYSALWKGKDPKLESMPVCVTSQPGRVSSNSSSLTIAEPDLPNPCENQVLHTQGGDMKCEAMGDVLLPQKNSLARGVRGDFWQFPQFSALSIPIPIPFDEVQTLIHRKVRSLGWSFEQISQFMADHFAGRSRIRELQEHELTTYLYYLQVETLEPRVAVLSG